MLPAIEVNLDWRHFFPGKADRPVLEEAFSAFITRSPWFGGRQSPPQARLDPRSVCADPGVAPMVPGAA